jgi:cell division protein ZapA
VSDVVVVSIFGRDYSLRTDEPEEGVQRLARLVDGEMRRVAEEAGTADTTKIAVMAAMRLAERLASAESASGSAGAASGEDVARRLGDLVDLIAREASE